MRKKLCLIAEITEKYATRSFLGFQYFGRTNAVFIHSVFLVHLLCVDTVLEAAD